MDLLNHSVENRKQNQFHFNFISFYKKRCKRCFDLLKQVESIKWVPVPIATELLGSWSDPGGLEMQCMEIRDTFEDARRKPNNSIKRQNSIVTKTPGFWEKFIYDINFHT